MDYTMECCAVLCNGMLRLTLFNPMDCGPPGFFVRGDSSGKNTQVGSPALLQGIFPTQESNPGLPHCRRILHQLSHKASPYYARHGNKCLAAFPLLLTTAL